MFNKKILALQLKNLISYLIDFHIFYYNGRKSDTIINIYKDFKLISTTTIPIEENVSNLPDIVEIPKISENDWLVSVTTKYDIIKLTTFFKDNSYCYGYNYNTPYQLKDISYIKIQYGGCCVPYYSKINTPNGLIEAQYIKENDIIYGYDFNENKVIETKVIKAVTATRDHIVKITLEDGSIIEITDNHTIYTTDGWACLDPENCDDFGLDPKENIAIQLDLKQECLTINNELKKIVSIEIIPQVPNIKVCMFTTKSENYFTQNYLVHNLAFSSTSQHSGGSEN